MVSFILPVTFHTGTVTIPASFLRKSRLPEVTQPTSGQSGTQPLISLTPEPVPFQARLSSPRPFANPTLPLPELKVRVWHGEQTGRDMNYTVGWGLGKNTLKHATLRWPPFSLGILHSHCAGEFLNAFWWLHSALLVHKGEHLAQEWE